MSNMCKLADYDVSIMSHGEKRLLIILVWKINGAYRWRIEHERGAKCNFRHWKWKVTILQLHRVQFILKWKRCIYH